VSDLHSSWLICC